MRLKHYQEKVLSELKNYLGELSIAKKEFEEILEIKPNLAKQINFPKEAWEKATNGRFYHSKTNGLGEPLPDVYLKVPTGGGKTLLACHAIDHINKDYLKRQTGLVLWIVPSTQIYRQTISALKKRDHPYRQILDISSGGRTIIKEKMDLFNRLDVEENLVVLMLMLPSANRQVKETLKVFKDSGGFTDFFPSEDNYPAQKAMLENIPNLDCFTTESEIFGIQIKTSLGNTLKSLRPIIIMDEGHRAYGENARNTICSFNPSFILELSATPPKDGVNKLVEITGRELNEEEMIKLDIHLINKTSLEWQNTMLSSIERRNELEKIAKKHEANTDENIRPICLIQVENTGAKQITKKTIHAEHVKEFLIKKCNIPEIHIAIKSSEKDDIEGIDLLAKDCEIRYIITKKALQEGWDCPFAYILTILTNPTSETGITQLIGRILRQPNARKTKIKQLDECYVYTFRQNASDLVAEISSGLQGEGMGDLASRIVSDDGGPIKGGAKDRVLEFRPGFKKFEGKIYLPKFVIQEKDSWRDLNYEADILGAIDWDEINLGSIGEMVLQEKKVEEQELVLGLSESTIDFLKETGGEKRSGTLEIDEVFLTRQITEIIPNPWICFKFGEKALSEILKKNDKTKVAANFVLIIEELKKVLKKERDRLAETIFKKMIEAKKLCFFLIMGEGGYYIPNRIPVKSSKLLVRSDNSSIQRSLFDEVPEDNMNELEKTVALYLDNQEKLLWWYRNMSRQDYHIQGWRKNKIYPDFIAATKDEKVKDDYGAVYVLETKGVHLAENDDTKYKQNVFELCTAIGAKKTWKDLFEEFPNKNFEFQVVSGDEWELKLNKVLA